MAAILILDGYAYIRELLMQELAEDGHMVFSSGRPELIKEIIPAFSPELVIMDIFIKGEVRWDALVEIKKINPHLPVLIFSSFSYDEDPRSSLASGYIIKNHVFDELKRNINKILSKPVPAKNLAGLVFPDMHSENERNQAFSKAN